MSDSDIICPFCQAKDFDLIGLKIHFVRGHCEAYNKTELPKRPETPRPSEPPFIPGYHPVA